ncbi:hypothetical protein EVAR_89342_1 [Eumeta japonica]|uniref:Uncharacterized protein n=1 Tax=Eumeta variegata TaxID=151549 RepID=A0A4C1Y1T9_EUMVA|nr:hypothetical protein EVAR_89342_1 [Eumeta japonica]
MKMFCSSKLRELRDRFIRREDFQLATFKLSLSSSDRSEQWDGADANNEERGKSFIKGPGCLAGGSGSVYLCASYLFRERTSHVYVTPLFKDRSASVFIITDNVFFSPMFIEKETDKLKTNVGRAPAEDEIGGADKARRERSGLKCLKKTRYKQI